MAYNDTKNTGSTVPATEWNDMITQLEDNSSSHDHSGAATHGKKIIAANVTSTATGDIVATNVDAAIAELELEKGVGDIVDGGNTTAATVVIGTNDANDLELETNGTTKVTIKSAGNVEFDIHKIDSIPDANTTVSGEVANEPTGSIAAFGDLLYLASDGEWTLADADVVGTMPGLRMATGATTDGGTADLLISGFARKDAWTWTVGNLIYVSCTGTTTNTMTQTKPSGAGDQVQIVGIATHADRIHFNPDFTYIEIV